MDVHEIEKYVSGEMAADEQAAFEQEMQQNPALSAEVARYRQLTGDLGDIALEDRISEALQHLPIHRDQKPGRWWLLLGLLSLLLLAGLFFYPAQSDADLQNLQSSPVPQPNPDSTAQFENQISPPIEQEEEAERPAIKKPIAGIEPGEQPVSPRVQPAPKLRGSGTAADTARQALLDAIWYTQYPPAQASFGVPFGQVDTLLRKSDFSGAYARLQLLERQGSAGDTLAFLKGYCLLERGEGAEALRYFDQIAKPQVFGSQLLNWYKGLALLLQGEQAAAKRQFEKIAQQQDQPLYPYALNALKKLE
ncbi:MAG: hypothetical protein KDC44_24070 [Phaeodactylibacter sp.]|nr:hypothetical protein [Phaeodactylibacter sp.]